MPFSEDSIVTDHKELVRFCPKAEHVNLEECDELQNLSCITDMIAADLISGDTSSNNS